MNEKMKELIAAGASISAHCQPCLTYHVARAKGLGVKDGNIQEAIAIGHMVEKGALSAMKQFSAGILDSSDAATTGCCERATFRSKHRDA